MPGPKVSVVVPVHRGAEALSTSLRSVLNQRFGDFEVLVAGDGADAEVERVASSTGDRRVRWLGFPKAPGFGYSNRRRAIDRAAADLIAYLAPDDLWAPDHLGRLVGLLDGAGLDLVFSRPILVWAGGVPRPHYLPFALAREGPDPPRALLCCVSPSHVLHTREIHDRAGGWNDALLRHGDVDLWLRIRSAGGRLFYLSEATSVRFPSYAFATRRRERHASLQREVAERLFSGTLSLNDLRWRASRRATGWIEEVFVAGLARGPRWARALIGRGRRATVPARAPERQS